MGDDLVQTYPQPLSLWVLRHRFTMRRVAQSHHFMRQPGMTKANKDTLREEDDAAVTGSDESANAACCAPAAGTRHLEA